MKQIRVKPDQVHKSNLYKIGYIFTNIYIHTYKIFLRYKVFLSLHLKKDVNNIIANFILHIHIHLWLTSRKKEKYSKNTLNCVFDDGLPDEVEEEHDDDLLSRRQRWAARGNHGRSRCRETTLPLQLVLYSR